MSKIKLTDKNVVTLRAGSNRETNYRDSQYPGLYLRITPKGVRSFVLRYSDRGRQRKHTLGQVRCQEQEDGITVVQARAAAVDFIARVKNGEDLRLETLKVDPWTVRKLADAYLKDKEQEVSAASCGNR